MEKKVEVKYEVGHKNIDPDTGDSTYTTTAYTISEDNAKLLVYCLQTLDEDPNTVYEYNEIK
jgi:hypothetical protein